MVLQVLGRAEHRQQPVAHELVRVAAMAGEHRDDELVERVQGGDDLAGARPLGERGELPDVEEHHGDLDVLPFEHRALHENAFREHRIDEGAERLA